MAAGVNAEERAAVIARARALRDAGDVDGANALLADAMGRAPVVPRATPPPQAGRPEPIPAGTLTARQQAQADRALHRGVFIEGSPDAIRERDGRRVQHVIGMLHDTFDNLPDSDPTKVPYPVAPNAPGQRWEATFGRMLRAAFAADPDLSADEVVAAVVAQVRHARRPLRLTREGFGNLITAARRGPARPVHGLCDMRGLRPNFTVWVGEMVERRDEYGRRMEADSDGYPG